MESSPGRSHFGLHSKNVINLYDELVPDLENISLPQNFKLYNYTNPKTNGELLHLIREAEFYGMLQKTLTKVDRASMANSIEVRVPFLKKKLVENVIKTGISVHSPLKKRKKILYDLLLKSFRNIKPQKKKKGFSIPLTNWIRKNYKSVFYEKLLDGHFCSSYGINKKEMENTLNEHMECKQDYKWPLFTLYSLAVWDDARE